MTSPEDLEMRCFAVSEDIMGEKSAIFKKVEGGWELTDGFGLEDGDMVRFVEPSKDPTPFHELPTYTVEQTGTDTFQVGSKE